MSSRSSRQLVRALLRGDQQAFARFFEDYFPPLFRFARARLAGDEHAAEEVVQETLIRAVRKLHTFRGEAALLTWLCTLCRNEIAAHSRRAGRRESVLVYEDEPSVRAALESLAARLDEQPEGGALRREVAAQVRTVLDALPPRYRSVLEWKYLHGESVRSVALRLEISTKAAESLLTRARGAFREAFLEVTVGLSA